MFQETMIKVWKGIINYREKERFSSWLFSIAHNVAIDNNRKHKRENLILDKNNETEQINNDTPLNILTAKETANSIEKTVHELPEKQKQVFLLRQHGEMTFREIADLMNEPINTVLSHMRYAVNKLKKELREENV